MSLLYAQLEKYKIDQRLIQIESEPNPDESKQGIVIDYSEEFVYLLKINEQGLQDGICIFPADRIILIRSAGNELESIAKLMELKDAEIVAPNFDLTSWQAVIESVNFRYNYITAMLDAAEMDACIIGSVEQIDEDYLLMTNLGTLSSPKPKQVLLSLSHLTHIEAGGSYERDLMLLKNES